MLHGLIGLLMKEGERCVLLHIPWSVKSHSLCISTCCWLTDWIMCCVPGLSPCMFLLLDSVLFS